MFWAKGHSVFKLPTVRGAIRSSQNTPTMPAQTSNFHHVQHLLDIFCTWSTRDGLSFSTTQFSIHQFNCLKLIPANFGKVFWKIAWQLQPIHQHRRYHPWGIWNFWKLPLVSDGLRSQLLTARSCLKSNGIFRSFETRSDSKMKTSGKPEKYGENGGLDTWKMRIFLFDHFLEHVTISSSGFFVTTRKAPKRKHASCHGVIFVDFPILRTWQRSSCSIFFKRCSRF